jgi:hypothetical protein
MSSMFSHKAVILLGLFALNAKHRFKSPQQTKTNHEF